MNKKIIITALLAFYTISGIAQTEESQTPREKQKWAVDGILMWLAPQLEYYDKNIERYNPPVPWVWFGSSWLNGGMMGDRQAQFHLRSGVFNKIDCGFTILQISRNLYRGVVGVSAGLQFGATGYKLSSGYGAEKDGYRVDIGPSDDNHKKDELSFAAVRTCKAVRKIFSVDLGDIGCLRNRVPIFKFV